MSQPRKIGVAICGLGRAGTIHIGNAVRNPRVCVKWIVEEDLERAIEVRNDCFLSDSVEIVNADNYSRALQDKSVEVVIVCTPTACHSSLIIAALKAGKAVFCEKPIAMEEKEVRTCYAAAKQYGQLLYCAFNRRFDPSIREIYTRVKAGEIGQVRSIKTTSRDYPKPTVSFLKISGGIFHDCATHDMDMICWIVGEVPSTIVCQAHSFIAEIGALNDVDQVGIMMKFPSGAIAQIDLNRNAFYGYDQRLEVFGSKGMLQTENQHQTAVNVNNENGSSSGLIKRSFPTRYKDSYILEFEHFLNVFQGSEPALDVTEDHCILATRLAESCEQSLKSGQLINFTMNLNSN